MRNLSLILQIGLTVVVPVVLLTLLGIWLDGKYGTSLTIWFVILGILGGASGAYGLAKRAISRDEPRPPEKYDLMQGYKDSEKDGTHEE